MGSKPCLFIITTLVLLAALPLRAEEPPPSDPRHHAGEIAPPDSLRHLYHSSALQPLVLDELPVRAPQITRRAAADHIVLSEEVLAARDAGSVADLGVLLPSTQLHVNSRGESLFLVRGASERQLGIELDGIAMTIPWDERSDLGMIPLVGVGSVVARRGVGSVLDAPNSLAGVVSLQSRWREAPGTHTRIGASIGEVESRDLRLLHERRDGKWQSTLALEHRQQKGFLLPRDYAADLHQGPGRSRRNTDFDQQSLLFGMRRQGSGRFRGQLLVQASRAEKGVAPEDHLADARFWRLPRRDRFLAALRATVDTTATSPWSWDWMGSADFFRQDIRPFEDERFQTPDLGPGVDFEADRDRTFLTEVRSTRHGPSWTWRSRARLRHSRHRESLVVAGPRLDYVQDLGGTAIEGEWRPQSGRVLRGGVGWEFSRTPVTGDKPARAVDHGVSAQVAAEVEAGPGLRWHANLSHRPRFASLRELFSGALGRFRVNPDLRPERQDALEIGGSRMGQRVDLSANVFAQRLDGAIERVPVAGTPLLQRVNLDSILNTGIELGLIWRVSRGLSFDWQQTFLHSRREDGGRVEDRPEWLSTLAVDYVHSAGIRGRLEAIGIGPRYSLDERAPSDGDALTRLDADLRANLRLSWRYFGRSPWFEGAEVYLRVDNLFDEITFSQLGLPESGRSARVGLRFDLRS